MVALELRHVADAPGAGYLGRELHALPSVLERDIVLLAARDAFGNALLVKRPDVVRPGEVLLVRVLRPVRGNGHVLHRVANRPRLERRALHPYIKSSSSKDVGHVPGVVVAAVNGVEVALQAVHLAWPRQDVAVVDVALRAVEHHAARIAERRRLEDLAGESRPVRRDRIPANDVGVSLEIDDADRLRALAVYAEDLDLLVRGIADGLDDVGVVRARVRHDLAVLHQVAAAKGNALRLAPAAGDLRRLQVCDCVGRCVCDARHDELEIGVIDLRRG